jgi:histidinol-phosphate aminotransferase
VEQAKSARLQIEQLCKELGVRCWHSSANFVLVRVGSSAAFARAMQERGIVVRDVSANPGCEGCVRITAARHEQMDEVLGAMRHALSELRK